WDLATGSPVGDPLIGHAGAVNAVAVATADGRSVVVSGADDLTVRLWDLATGSPVGDPLIGHAGAVNAVAVATADGRSVVVSGADKDRAFAPVLAAALNNLSIRLAEVGRQHEALPPAEEAVRVYRQLTSDN